MYGRRDVEEGYEGDLEENKLPREYAIKHERLVTCCVDSQTETDIQQSFAVLAGGSFACLQHPLRRCLHLSAGRATLRMANRFAICVGWLCAQPLWLCRNGNGKEMRRRCLQST